MGEMKNLAEDSWQKKFIDRFDKQNAELKERERLLWRSLPQWRLILHFLGFKRQMHRAFYDNRWRLCAIEYWAQMPKWRRLLWEIGVTKPTISWFINNRKL